jgi:hypothetical protein
MSFRAAARAARLRCPPLLALLLVLLAMPTLAQRVGARELSWIEYGHDGERYGEYRQVEPGRWLEDGGDGRFYYDELRRDAHSVYLQDRRRGVELRLDLRGGQAWYRERGRDWEPRYSIWGGRGGPLLGRTAAAVSRCHAAVQGRIAWDYEGSTLWEPQNLDRLCGDGRSAEPARCFQQALHGGVDWGGGTHWEWENAIALCQGTQDARATIGCFRSRVRQGYAWEEAIEDCAAY